MRLAHAFVTLTLAAASATDLTTARAAIVHINGPVQTVTPGLSLVLDADSDGATDLTLRIFDDGLNIHDVAALGIVASDISAARVSPGALIGPASPYINVGWLAAGGSIIDPWNSQPLGMIGLRFQNASGVHYGWARINVEIGALRFEALAYETTPNTPIAAGAVPAPGVLAALGCGLFAACRRRR